MGRAAALSTGTAIRWQGERHRGAFRVDGWTQCRAEAEADVVVAMDEHSFTDTRCTEI